MIGIYEGLDLLRNPIGENCIVYCEAGNSRRLLIFTQHTGLVFQQIVSNFGED